MELPTTDILRSLNFLLKCYIVNDAFPWSCCFISVEIVILHFVNSFCIYVFSLRILSKISLDILSRGSFVPMCKMMYLVISEVVTSYNHICRLYDHLGSILIWPCVFQILSSLCLFQPTSSLQQWEMYLLAKDDRAKLNYN